MSSEEAMMNAQEVKVRDLVRLLKANEEFLASVGRNEKLVLFIRQFRAVLKPYGNLDGTEILEPIKQSLESEMVCEKVSPIFDEIHIESLSLDGLKDLVSKESLSIKALLLIAERRLGIPTGTLKKMKKDLIRQRILNTIQNIEKLDTIKEKAAE